MSKHKFKYINLFSGIGGWELGLADLPMENVLSCEIDKYARETFLANFSHLPCIMGGQYHADVRELQPNEIPDFDILVASPPMPIIFNGRPSENCLFFKQPSKEYSQRFEYLWKLYE